MNLPAFESVNVVSMSRFVEGEPSGRLGRAVRFLNSYRYAATAALHLVTFGLRSARSRQQIAALARADGA